MLLDQRLREGLHKASETIDPEMQGRLAAALERASAARRRRIVGTTLLAAAAAVLLMLAMPALRDVLRDAPSGDVPASGSAPFPIRAGSYVVRVDRASAIATGVVPREAEGFAGRYVFTFAADGSYTWSETTPNPFIKDGGGGITTWTGDLVTFPHWLKADARERVTVRVLTDGPEISFVVVSARPTDVAPFARALFQLRPWTGGPG
jgi:hypothetical protein